MRLKCIASILMTLLVSNVGSYILGTFTESSIFVTKSSFISPKTLFGKKSHLNSNVSLKIGNPITLTTNEKIRNIAVIAHVDHGKTTLVDALIKQSGVFRDDKQALEAGDAIMDSKDQERERGITIIAKNLAIMRNDVKINIMDTPGHADFGGEVERVLNMADGALLVVDSVEGPKPQTRFVLDKALQKGLKVLLVVNKIDRPAARPNYVVDSTFDLFMDLGASDDQMDFRVIYSSGLYGKAGNDHEHLEDNFGPLFDAIVESLPPPRMESLDTNNLQALISSIDHDDFKGMMGIARINNGVVKSNQSVALQRPGRKKKTGRITKLYIFDNLGRKEVDMAAAGEIIMFSGLSDIEIGDTLVSNEAGGVNAAPPLPPIYVEQPTVRMTLGVNKSPLSGREGKFLTSRMIRDRLFKELDSNVALHVEDTPVSDRYMISGRGQLHLTVLIENMRREGFELEVGPPSVVYKRNKDTGQIEEPWEVVEIRVPNEYSGACIEILNQRKGLLRDMGIEDDSISTNIIKYLIPTRGMLGLRSSLLTATCGTIIIDSVFDSYRPRVKGNIQGRKKGSLLASTDGKVTSFGLEGAQDRGKLIIKPNDDVYKGMIVGIHQRTGDLVVNVCKSKKLTNVRSNKDATLCISAPFEMSLDACVEYLAPDEHLEVTPACLRMAKNPNVIWKSGK